MKKAREEDFKKKERKTAKKINLNKAHNLNPGGEDDIKELSLKKLARKGGL